MYNESLKLRYISESSDRNCNVERQMLNQFNGIAGMEELLGKDCCQFTTREIISYYKTISTTSIHYLVIINSWLKIYTSWCMSQNLVDDKQNHYAVIDTNILEQCINPMLQRLTILTRQQLVDMLNRFENASDACLCLALFEGILGKGKCELIEWSPDNFIDDNKVSFVSSGRTLSISDKLSALAKDSIATFDYTQMVESPSARVYTYADGDDHVFKPFRNSQSGRMTFFLLQNKMVRIREYEGSPAFVVGYLVESGRIQYINDLLKQHSNWSLMDCLKDEGMIYRYGEIHSKSGYINLYKEYFSRT